jgi:hypothetical protein
VKGNDREGKENPALKKDERERARFAGFRRPACRQTNVSNQCWQASDIKF